jgi:glycosyltransferase involved in cell wall biosynthesis
MSSHSRPSVGRQRNPEPYSVSVIVPTRNEADNVRELTRRLSESMAPLELQWELIFVDDSDDETPDQIRSLTQDSVVVKLVHRVPGERQGGLAGAVVEGFAAAEGNVMVVMDGDLQHPPESVPSLVSPILSGACAMAVGSRFVASANADGLAGPFRRAVSQGSRLIVRGIFPSIWEVRDPMSGFFAFKRNVIRNVVLAPKGFKILLEVLIRGHWSKAREVPIEFAARMSGGSKAGWREGTQLVHQILRLRWPGAGSQAKPAGRRARTNLARRSFSESQAILSVVGDASSS